MKQINFIKHILLTIVVAIMAALPSWGQEYEVVSFEQEKMDLTARTEKPRIDTNGRKCALLKVYVNDSIAAARGAVVGAVESTGMEKWIYMSQDAKRIELVFDNHYPLTLTFEDYNYPTLAQQMVYIVKLREKASAAAPAQTVTQTSGSSANQSMSVNEIRREAIAAYDAKMYEQALALFREIDHDAEAQYYLGEMYLYGYGVMQDYTVAVRWYRKSADKGYVKAQSCLGYMYRYGFGVSQDDNEAVKWYRMAAEQGNSNAQNNLGYMYMCGFGVSQDDNEAVKWYRMGAEQGDSHAQTNLGYMYENGKGVQQDYTEAASWYRKSAEQGDPRGYNCLGNLFYEGHGVKKDFTEAVKYYRMSASQGNDVAQNNLGFFYFFGIGVPQDREKAIE